jgi:hypothetical protein
MPEAPPVRPPKKPKGDRIIPSPIVPFPAAFPLAVALSLVLSLVFSSCVFSPAYTPRPKARPYDIPQGNRLVLGVPFFPDDTNLCGPASLAAVLTFNGYPSTVQEVAEKIQRWDIGGSVGPDLVLHARSLGAKARFFSATPEELEEFVNKQVPVIVQVNRGIGPVVRGHFMVVVGYSFDGVVANNGFVQQEIIPWDRFLTDWHRMGNFAMVVDLGE